MSARVVIAGPAETSFDAELDEDLLEVLQRNGYPISTSCGGIASCGLCRITVLEGKHNLTPIQPQELGHLGNVAKVIGLRLACQSKIVVEGDIVVRVPEVEDVEEKKRKKADRLRAERRPARAAGKAIAVPIVAASSPTDEAPPSIRHVSRAPRADLIEWRPRILMRDSDASPNRDRDAGASQNRDADASQNRDADASQNRDADASQNRDADASQNRDPNSGGHQS
jgi:ferredoxin, 2Fe-2S